MKRFLIMTLVSFGALAQSPAYVAEGLMAVDGNPQFCVTDVNTSMPDRSYDSRGNAGASFSCSLDYSIRRRDQYGGFNSPVEGGRRALSYQALPARTRSDRHMRNRTGYVAGPAGFSIHGLSDHAIRSMYATAESLSEVFSVELVDDVIQLTTPIREARAQQDVACLVVSLELLNAACDGFQDQIRESIIQKIRRIQSDARLREMIVPRR